MGTQRKDIIALRLRDKYDEARDRLRDSGDAYGSLESAIEERESTILDLRMTDSMASWRMRK
jgi:hypothetical protein